MGLSMEASLVTSSILHQAIKERRPTFVLVVRQLDLEIFPPPSLFSFLHFFTPTVSHPPTHPLHSARSFARACAT